MDETASPLPRRVGPKERKTNRQTTRQPLFDRPMTYLRRAALPLTWALKASVAAICVFALVGCRRAAGASVSAAPWVLFFLGTAISSGLYSAVEARPPLEDAAAVTTLELAAVNLSAVGAWVAGGQLFAMAGSLRPVRAAYAALVFRLTAIALLCGLNAVVFTSQPSSSRLDLALSLASVGAVGLIAGAVAGLRSASRLAAPLRAPSVLVIVGVSLTGAGFAVGEGWLGPACASPAQCPLPHWLEPEAVEHAALAASCIVLAAAACIILRSRRRGAGGGWSTQHGGAGPHERLLEGARPTTPLAAAAAATTGPALPLPRTWLECGVCGRRCLFMGSVCCSQCGFGCCPWCLDDDRAAPLDSDADTAAQPTCFVCRLQERARCAPAPPVPLPSEAGPRFVVVGAGIVGSFCALELARRGFAVDVVEAAEGAGTWRGIINLNAQGVALVRDASATLAAAIEAEHHVARTATFWDAHLEAQVLEYDLAKEGRRYELPGVMVTCERRRLLEQLRGAAQEAGARLRVGCRVERVVDVFDSTSSHDTDTAFCGGVDVHLADGSCVHADYVIACDGVHSPVREALFARHGGDSPQRSTGHYACGGIARGVELPQAASADQTELWGPAGCFLLFRYKDGVVFWAALRAGGRPVHPQDESRDVYQRRLLAGTAAAFDRYHPVVRALLDATELDSVGCFELRDVRLSRWSVGRVLLLGDAAHAMCNRLGSGGCTGMEDARVAADLIDACLRAGAGGAGGGGGTRHESVLEAFRLTERRRMPRARRVQFESYALALSTVNLAANGALRAVRDAALRWVGRRSERWRLPIFDFLNNYRVGCDRRLQHGAHRKPADK